MHVSAIVIWLAFHGCPLPCAAGVVANFERESGPGLDPTANNRMGQGLPGWAGPRRHRMRAALGMRWTDGYAQLEYMMTEGPWLAIRDRMAAARDPAAAAAIFFSGFEWPGRRVPAKTVRRARVIYREMTR